MTDIIIIRLLHKGIPNEGLKIIPHTARKYLWDEVTSLYCTCSHSLPDHSRNDDPREGHCVVRGCPCMYFTPYRAKKPRLREWEGSW